MVNKINIKNRSSPGEWRLSESHTTGEVPGTTDEGRAGKVGFLQKCKMWEAVHPPGDDPKHIAIFTALSVHSGFWKAGRKWRGKNAEENRRRLCMEEMDSEFKENT